MPSGRSPISKALKALACVVESSSQQVGVRELAAAIGMSPSSAHRLLLALAEEGFVQRDPRTARYALGVEFFRLAGLTSARSPLLRISLQPMRDLVNACNETALLGIYDSIRREMMFAASVESTHALRYAIELNKWIPVHAGASGLTIMAYLSEAEVRSIVQRTRLASLTERTITDSYRLHAELEAIRAQGYALSRGQRIPGAVGLAAPILNGNGEIQGDVCLTIPEQRFRNASKDHLIKLLLNCTKAIMKQMGVPSHRNAAA